MKKPKKRYEYEVKHIVGSSFKYKIVRHKYVGDVFIRSSTVYKGLDKGVADDYLFRLERGLPIIKIL